MPKPHNVHSIDGIHNCQANAHPLLPRLRNRFQFIMSPCILLVCGPRMQKCTNNGTLLFICRAWMNKTHFHCCAIFVTMWQCSSDTASKVQNIQRKTSNSVPADPLTWSCIPHYTLPCMVNIRSTNQANSAFHPSGVCKWVVIHVITWTG